ncbi:unnamed protein product [Sphagnum balticum]
MEKETHLDVAIGQRHMVSNFVKEFVRHHAPNQPVPPTIILDQYDDEHCDDDGGDSDMILSTITLQIQIQIKDFGGSFAMPHYGHLHPSVNYFNSNFMVSNFVVVDLISNSNDVFFYDERAQGKDVDALFSLRFTYHLEKFKTLLSHKITMPKTLLVILDNCVGQNKSYLVMQLFTMLSILFYLKVVLVYLIPRHSHNTANWVITWCRNVMKGKNFYSPMAIIEAVNEVKGVNTSFIDHRDARRPCYVSWGPILKKHFKSLLARYTFNYFFEFDEGHVNMRSLC